MLDHIDREVILDSWSSTFGVFARFGENLSYNEINVWLELLADPALDPGREVPPHLQLAMDVSGVDGLN
jgi:hypothetical protein